MTLVSPGETTVSDEPTRVASRTATMPSATSHPLTCSPAESWTAAATIAHPPSASSTSAIRNASAPTWTTPCAPRC
ncbi:hypothetical protein [Tessaracoccus coleopterorum]|uniref:hypothetical protein n=1 Tax=Tessaracoccus coleopterorum TaxID=2714950 RepID=UPI001E488EDA|nr:hypothetical protein [Tessaracoccus coleopterorum]